MSEPDLVGVKRTMDAELALGFVLGIAASLAAWWMVAWLYIPRLLISEINRLEDPASQTGVRYRVKVRNPSRTRLVAGLEVQARLSIRGLMPHLPTNLTSFHIPMGSAPTFPVLAARDERMYTLQLRMLEERPQSLSLLPDEVRSRISTISLEELLAQGTEAFLRVAVSGTHEFSGYRRTYCAEFRAANIHEGRFEKNSIAIVPASDTESALLEKDDEPDL